MQKKNKRFNKYGNWACILGAAQGLGASFAKKMADRGFHLILVDIQSDRLKEVSEALQNTYKINTIEFVADLNLPSCIDPILNEIKKQSCRFIIYNAAYGPVKHFLSNTKEELDQYVNVNIRTTLHLVRGFIELNQNREIGILLLSSLAGFRGTAFVIPYAATKAFLWNFAEGIYYEFQNQPVDISVCVAGATATPNFLSTQPKKTLFAPEPMDPDTVAEESLQLFGKKLFIVPGTANKISHFILNRILPRKWASSILNNTMKNMYT